MEFKKIDPAMTPAKIFNRPSAERFQDYYRRWQGIAAVERVKSGRLFVNFFSGQDAEVGGNSVILCVSDDDGKTFESAVTAVEHPDMECRVYNQNLWVDPYGKLWLIWNQTRGFDDGRCGVWVSICDNPDAQNLEWTKPRRIANGIMLNKPIVTSKNEWVFPSYIRNDKTSGVHRKEDEGLDEEKYSNIYVSTDEGKTFSLRGSADVPNRQADEHMVVEKKDGSLWMLVRTLDGIGESISYDNGYTWTPGRNSDIKGPCSRFFITRLTSGRLLLINHYNFEGEIDEVDILNQDNVKTWKGRNNLTALLSEDDGKTWPYSLLLDEREEVAYPDAVEGSDGYIYAVYDYERVKEREIIMARFTEEDILNGSINPKGGYIKNVVNKAMGMPDIE